MTLFSGRGCKLKHDGRSLFGLKKINKRESVNERKRKNNVGKDGKSKKSSNNFHVIS